MDFQITDSSNPKKRRKAYRKFYRDNILGDESEQTKEEKLEFIRAYARELLGQADTISHDHTKARYSAEILNTVFEQSAPLDVQLINRAQNNIKDFILRLAKKRPKRATANIQQLYDAFPAIDPFLANCVDILAETKTFEHPTFKERTFNMLTGGGMDNSETARSAKLALD